MRNNSARDPRGRSTIALSLGLEQRIDTAPAEKPWRIVEPLNPQINGLRATGAARIHSASTSNIAASAATRTIRAANMMGQSSEQ